VRTALCTLLVAACGHPATSPSVPSQTTGGPTKAELPAGPPLATPGERMSYKVALQGIDIARYDLGVTEVQDVGGKRAVVVQSHAQLVGLAKLIGGQVDDKHASWIDVQNGRPVRFQSDEYATGSTTDVEHTIIDFAGRKEDMIPITFGINDGTPAPEPQKVSVADVWDYDSFLFALRAWEAPVGSTVSTEVFRSRYLWHVDIKVRGREKVATDLEVGEMSALRFDAHTYKLARDGTKFPNTDERDFSVWVSDDDGRVPLQTVARTDYGDIKMKIVDYQPGNGQRLRP
jgi:hypothetical protein